jgi:germination protein M
MARKPKPAKTPQKRRKPPVGCLVWLTLLVIVSVAFFAARASIARSVQSSGLSRLVGLPQKESDTPAPASPVPAATAPVAAPTEASPVERTPTPQRDTAVAAEKPRETPPSPARPSAVQPTRTPSTSATSPAPKSTQPAVQRRRSTLYFAKVSDDGSITLSGLPRSVSFTDAPLTQTLEALVAGPTADETGRGFRSLIPPGTRVENVRIEGRTAHVSFSESFRFNSYGKDGLVVQLRQVVYTATEFGNVDRVQVLIAGRVTDYLGPEGIRIREPLSRESFANGRL